MYTGVSALGATTPEYLSVYFILGEESVACCSYCQGGCQLDSSARAARRSCPPPLTPCSAGRAGAPLLSPTSSLKNHCKRCHRYQMKGAMFAVCIELSG